MTFLASLNLAADEVMQAFWHGVGVLGEEESIPEPEAFDHLRRELLSRVKAVKVTHGMDYVPDGRAARWRVRLTIWTGPASGELYADSDAPAPPERPGATLIHGLPAVAAWVWDLIQQAHPGRTVEELGLAEIKHKIRTLRVALSNQGGACAWRLRYSLAPSSAPQAAHTPGSLRGVRAARAESQAFLAYVQVSREEAAPRKVAPKE